MKVGLDTGFILKLYLREKKVIALWEKFLKEEVKVVTNLLCGYEFFKVLGARGESLQRLKEFWQFFVSGVEVAGINEELILEGAKFEIRYRLGAFDSLILMSFLRAECSRVYTTDTKWKQKVKGIKIVVV